MKLNSILAYGTKNAPFLATRTLQQLALDESQTFPKTYKTLLNNFYVDDNLSGTHTISTSPSERTDCISWKIRVSS